MSCTILTLLRSGFEAHLRGIANLRNRGTVSNPALPLTFGSMYMSNNIVR